MILALEIFCTADFFIGIGNLFIISFLAVIYYRLRKLFQILDRQEKLKSRQ